MKVLRKYEDQVEEVTRWIAEYRQTFWEVEEYRPRLLKEKVHWALDFETKERNLVSFPYNSPINGTLLPGERGINQSITKEVKKLMRTLMNKTSTNGMLIFDFQKFKLANAIESQMVYHPEFENIHLMAIMVKAIFLTLCFYQKLMELGKVPRNCTEKTKQLFQMIDDYRFDYIIPAAMILAFEILGEKAPGERSFDTLHDHIIKMCHPEETQDIRKHYQVMKMTLKLCSMDMDPISRIMNYPNVHNDVKCKAIDTLNNLLEAGLITNPSVGSACIAKMAIDKAINDLANMVNTQFFNDNPDLDQGASKKGVEILQPINSNLTVLNGRSANENDDPKQANEVQMNMDEEQDSNDTLHEDQDGMGEDLNMDEEQHSNDASNEDKDSMAEDGSPQPSHVAPTDLNSECTNENVNPRQANEALLNSPKICIINQNIAFNPSKRTYMCRRCDYYEDVEQGKVRRHLKTCTKDTRDYRFRCNKCKKRFVKKYSLVQHSPNCHPKNDNYNSDAIDTSIEFDIDAKQVKCMNCAVFARKERWQVARHVRSCLMNRRFKCNLCMLGLLTKEALDQHKKKDCKLKGVQ